MKKILFITLIIASLSFSGCKKAPATPTAQPEQEEKHHSETLEVENNLKQESERDVHFTCGNTITKLYIGDGINEEQTTYEFEGGNSVYLSQLLADLKYSPEKLCKCLPEYKVDTEYKLGYGISLGETPYARCDQGQAELTKEQAEKIQTIIEEVKSGKIF